MLDFIIESTEQKCKRLPSRPKEANFKTYHCLSKRTVSNSDLATAQYFKFNTTRYLTSLWKSANNFLWKIGFTHAKTNKWKFYAKTHKSPGNQQPFSRHFSRIASAHSAIYGPRALYSWSIYIPLTDDVTKKKIERHRSYWLRRVAKMLCNISSRAFPGLISQSIYSKLKIYLRRYLRR